MSVGLYDADFFKYHQTIFNLELMKMATYYKRKKEITVMAPSFAPERYTKFFYRKDFNDGEFRKDLTQYQNIIYGGRAFSNNKYIPLSEEIEQCIPDVSIYERYKNLFIEEGRSNKVFYTSLMRGVHFRLSLDGKTVWKDFEKQIPKGTKGRVFFLHDYNLNDIELVTENIMIVINKYRLSENSKTSISNKFPIICSNYTDFCKWLYFTFASINFLLQYDGIFTDLELVTILSQINQTQAKNITYNLFPASSSKNDFSETSLIKIFKQVLFLYRNQKQFLLTYSDSFQIPDEIKKMLNLFTAYGRSSITPPTSLFYFVKQLRETNKYHRELITQPEAIKVFLYVQKNYPELFKMFYENSGAEFRGGELQLVG
jgi:hypothetical protein